MTELNFDTIASNAGFRLQYLEVLNWGTFNQNMWKIWILRTIVYHLFQRIVYQCFSPKFTSNFCFGVFISGHSLPLVAT
jgi:hypothetical protein